MAQASNQVVKSFIAGAALTQGRIVVITGAGTVGESTTSTAYIAGVVLQDATTSAAVAVVIGGTAKCLCAASISAGCLVGPATAGGGITERANPAAGATAATQEQIIGVALEKGTANSLVEVLLQINNFRATS